MKKTSKILSMILALMMIMSVMIIPASAEAGPWAELTIVTDTADVQVGDLVTADVVLSENSSLGTITVDFLFDSTVFEPVSMTAHGLFNLDDDDNNEAYNLNYADGMARFTAATADFITEGGTLFTVVLRAISETSESDLSLSVEEAVDNDYTNVYIFTYTASISVFDEIVYPSLTVVADKDRVEIGDIVTVDVYLSENSYISALTVDLIYDSDCFTPVNMYSSGLFPTYSDFDGTNMNYADGAARFTGAVASAVKEGGILFTVVFEVIGDAENSVMWVSVAEATDADFNDVYVETYDICFNEIIDIYFYEPSRTTIRHKDGIKLYYYITSYDLPEGWYVVFDCDNDNFDIEYNEEDDSYTIISAENGYTTFYINLIDDNGDVVSSDTLEMRSKAGFFDKIGSFFRSIFGGTTIYEY